MNPTVLIFEDSDILRSTLKYILNERGYEVFTFSNGIMCPVSDTVYHTCPLDHGCADIIISDVKIPTESGIELIKKRQQKGCKVQNRAFMSVDWSYPGLKYVQNIGGHIFHKPFNLRKMIKWLDDCVQNYSPSKFISPDIP